MTLLIWQAVKDLLDTIFMAENGRKSTFVRDTLILWVSTYKTFLFCKHQTKTWLTKPPVYVSSLSYWLWNQDALNTPSHFNWMYLTEKSSTSKSQVSVKCFALTNTNTNNNNRIKETNLKCKLHQSLWPGQKPLFNRKLGTSAQNQANSCSVSSDYVKGSMCGGMHDSCQHKWKCSWIKNSLHKELIIILLSIASLRLRIFHIV